MTGLTIDVVTSSLNDVMDELTEEYTKISMKTSDLGNNLTDVRSDVIDFLEDCVEDVILKMPLDDTIYQFIHDIYDYCESKTELDPKIPLQDASFSYREYTQYISGLYQFTDKMVNSITKENEIDKAGDILDVFENDKKFIDAIFDSDVIMEKTGKKSLMFIENGIEEYEFLIRFREYIKDFKTEITTVPVKDECGEVERRLEFLKYSSISCYVFKQIESVLHTLQEIAKIVYIVKSSIPKKEVPSEFQIF